MLQIVVVLVGAVVGFVASRALRRPQGAAQAASVARSVSAGFGGRKGLTPPELQRACFSEMVRHVQVNRQGRTHAPARYVLHLHPDDLAIVDDGRRWFTNGLIDALRQAASQHGWALAGRVDIDYVADPARRPGVPSALAVAPDEPRTAAPSAPPPAPAPAPATAPQGRRSLVLVRSDTGERIALRGEAVTVGRSRDRDITIDDNRISRAHARFEARSRGWVIVDEGSANGTTLRGRALEAHQAAELRPGDVVQLGPVELKVTAGARPSAEPGTRALDDGDRNRISREFLPPTRDGRR